MWKRTCRNREKFSNSSYVQRNRDKTLGKKRLTLKNPKNNKKYNVEFVIVNADVKPILGARAIQHMKLVTVNQENMLNLNQIQSAKSAEEPKKKSKTWKH